MQNLLPCKSAAAAAAAAAGRGRVLTNGQPLPGAGTVTGNTLLYEDLMESTVHSQIHNHLPPQPGLQPTIEVRGTNTSRQQVSELQPPHHLDYLDYRDPRSILCATDKPSRAVLGGGYRTPQALLAKSLPRTRNIPINLRQHNESQNLMLLASHNVLVTRPNSISTMPNLSETINGYRDANNIRPFTLTNVMIAPIHQSQNSEYNRHNNDYQSNINSNTIANDNSHKQRRFSVDSEGYSYIDFDDRKHNRLPVDSCNCIIRREIESHTTDPSCQRLLDTDGIGRERSNTIERYKYIDSVYSQIQDFDRPAVDEEICPLCTMQQIHHLLALPDQTYDNEVGKSVTG